MNKEIDFIKDYIAKNGNTIEAENIARDLSLFVSRIKTGEYKNTDIISRQSFDSHRRTFEFHNYLIGYYNSSRDWVEILKLIPLEKISNICDLCPGHSPKVQWALHTLKYNKKLFIVDKDMLAINQMQTLLNIIGVEYHHTFLQQDIFSLQGKYDVITANHIFDDIVLNDYCIQSGKSLRDLYENEQTLCASISDIIKYYDQDRYANKLVSLLDSHINASGYITLSHYSGLTETALQLNTWVNWIYQIMRETCIMLENKNYKIIYSNMDTTTISTNNSKKIFLLLKKQS